MVASTKPMVDYLPAVAVAAVARAPHGVRRACSSVNLQAAAIPSATSAQTRQTAVAGTDRRLRSSATRRIKVIPSACAAIPKDANPTETSADCKPISATRPTTAARATSSSSTRVIKTTSECLVAASKRAIRAFLAMAGAHRARTAATSILVFPTRAVTRRSCVTPRLAFPSRDPVRTTRTVAPAILATSSKARRQAPVSRSCPHSATAAVHLRDARSTDKLAPVRTTAATASPAPTVVANTHRRTEARARPETCDQEVS